MATYTQKYHTNTTPSGPMGPPGGPPPPPPITTNIATFAIAEQYMYGSARLGYAELNRILDTVQLNTLGYNGDGSFDAGTWTATSVSVVAYKYDYIKNGIYNVLNGVGLTRGYKRFELSNHLGNVLVVVTDRHLSVDVNGNTTGEFFQPYIQSIQDYYPFGSELIGRSYTITSGKNGFNGKEKDNDFSVDDYNFDARIFSARICRWLSIDKLCQKYPNVSPYIFAINNPIFYQDIDGNDIVITTAFFNSPYYPMLDFIITNREALGVSSKLNVFLKPLNASDAKSLTFKYDFSSSFLDQEGNPVIANAHTDGLDGDHDASSIYGQGELYNVVQYPKTGVQVNPDDRSSNSAGAGSFYSFKHSNLALFVTVMHEICHIDETTGHGKSEPQLAASSIDIIAKAVLKYATEKLGRTDITETIARNLAWEGLAGTPAFDVEFGPENNRNAKYNTFLSDVQHFGRVDLADGNDNELPSAYNAQSADSQNTSPKTDSSGQPANSDKKVNYSNNGNAVIKTTTP